MLKELLKQIKGNSVNDCDLFCIIIPFSTSHYDNLLPSPKNPAMLWVLTEILEIAYYYLKL